MTKIEIYHRSRDAALNIRTTVDRLVSSHSAIVVRCAGFDSTLKGLKLLVYSPSGYCVPHTLNKEDNEQLGIFLAKAISGQILHCLHRATLLAAEQAETNRIDAKEEAEAVLSKTALPEGE